MGRINYDSSVWCGEVDFAVKPTALVVKVEGISFAWLVHLMTFADKGIVV